MSTETRITVKLVEASQIIDLRWEVLRPGRARQSVEFFEDRSETAVHVAVFDSEFSRDQPVSCGSFRDMPLQHHQMGWHHYALATRHEHRQLGLATRLLTEARQHLANRSGLRRMWTDAPVSVIPFYERLGWMRSGYQFMFNKVPYSHIIWLPER